SDWSSDVCSSDLLDARPLEGLAQKELGVEARALDSARPEVVGRPAKDRLDGPLLRVGRRHAARHVAQNAGGPERRSSASCSIPHAAPKIQVRTLATRY